MIETFLALLAAHLVADFVIQTDWVVAKKKRWWGMALHIAGVAVTAVLALGAFNFAVLALIVGSHLVMDLIKTFLMRDTPRAFVVDQLVHLAAIVLAAFAFSDAAAQGWWGQLPAAQQNLYWSVLTWLSALILVVPVGGILAGKIMARWAEKGGVDDGLPNAGKYIGWLERGLILLLVVTGQAAGVGLLLAAKSILRFNDVKQMRAHTEYVIVGTLISFAWALSIATVTLAALARWA